jgi:hypothetical protein
MEQILTLPQNFLRRVSYRTWIWLVGTTLCVPGMYLVLHARYSIIIFLTFSLMYYVIWSINRRAAILSTFVYLLFLGDIRRFVSMIIGLQPLDPLILLGSAVATLLALPLLLRVRLTDRLSKPILALTIIMALEVFNPRQGNLATGLSGALFFIAPMFWFWISRKYSSDRLMLDLLYKIIIPIGTLAALLGIYQTYVGFLPWQNAWIKASIASGYTALFLGGGHIRSFGFSSNSAEYGNLLLVTSLCVVAAAFAGRRAYLLLLPILITGQLLASQRSPILRLIFAIVLIWAVRGKDIRAWLPKLVFGLPIGFALLYFAVSSSGDDSAPTKKSNAASFATSHVTRGLSHPFDPRYSTAGLHSEMFATGLMSGIVNPLGNGLGVVTLGAGKFGGGDPTIPGSSEVDISDVFNTTGIIGGIAYLVTIGIGLVSVLNFTRFGPPAIAYPILAVLVGLLGAWIPLGQYAIGPFLWFCLGYLSHEHAAERSMEISAAIPNGGSNRTTARSEPQ